MKHLHFFVFAFFCSYFVRCHSHWKHLNGKEVGEEKLPQLMALICKWISLKEHHPNNQFSSVANKCVNEHRRMLSGVGFLQKKFSAQKTISVNEFRNDRIHTEHNPKKSNGFECRVCRRASLVICRTENEHFKSNYFICNAYICFASNRNAHINVMLIDNMNILSSCDLAIWSWRPRWIIVWIVSLKPMKLWKCVRNKTKKRH